GGERQGQAGSTPLLLELRMERGQDRGGSFICFNPIDAARDGFAGYLPPPLDPVDELAMDQLWRLLLIGSSEVMPEVVDHVERQQTQGEHRLDRIEIEGRQMVYPQEGVFRKEVLNAPPFGRGRHGGVRGHGAGGRDEREVRVIGPLL